jgi:hypothetical protein
MNKALPFKAGKAVLKTGAKILKFSFKIAITAVVGKKVNKKIKAFREWQDDYDEYAKSITRHEPF